MREAPRPEDAFAIQERLRREVVLEDRLGPVRSVAGADVAYAADGVTAFAAVAVLETSTLERVEVAAVRSRCTFPYRPGLLSFREIPPLLDAFARLRAAPDLVLCDGQGWAHPRRFGLACHLGVVLDLPTIGCAKSRLVGENASLTRARGSHVPLIDGGEVVGEVVRTREGVRPLYVSAGHRVSLATARDWVLRLAQCYRIPEPLRAADAEVRRRMREG